MKKSRAPRERVAGTSRPGEGYIHSPYGFIPYFTRTISSSFKPAPLFTRNLSRQFSSRKKYISRENLHACSIFRTQHFVIFREFGPFFTGKPFASAWRLKVSGGQQYEKTYVHDTASCDVAFLRTCTEPGLAWYS